VESNFERFVRAKATIDNVYNEMRNHGAEPDSPKSRPTSGRGRARSSANFKSIYGQLSPNPSAPPASGKKKNALLKETDYGVSGIRAPLTEATAKAEEVWGPALGGREREETLKAILNSIEKNRGIFEVGSSIHESIKRKDYERLVEEYTRARRYANDARNVVENSMLSRMPMTDPQIHLVIVTARMWTDVEDQIGAFKRELWRKLSSTNFSKQQPTDQDKPEEYLELIGVLLELGVEENPIWMWLLSRFEYLKSRISITFERAKVEVEILRRRLGNGEKPSLKQIAGYLRSAADQGRSDASACDSPKVLEFWEHLFLCLNTILSTKTGVLGEVIEFWETAQSFIDGKAQRKLPIGPDGQSRHHHNLTGEGIKELKAGTVELISIMRDNIFAFFADPPIEDVSMLFSPIPTSPDSPIPKTPLTPLSAALSPMDSRFKFDANSMPPPSPRLGENWEKYAFWPPYASSLSGVQYLSQILVLVGTAASEMAMMSVMREGSRSSVEQLRTLVGGVRERCVQALCASWNKDAENCKVMEDWTRSADSRNMTKMPKRFVAFEGALLGGMQKILYVSEAMTRPGATEVVVPPPSKILQMVRSQFVTSLYKALSGMVENAERHRKLDDGHWKDDVEGLTIPAKNVQTSDLRAGTVDATNRVRHLLSALTLVFY
jgi:exocyst complex component 2